MQNTGKNFFSKFILKSDLSQPKANEHVHEIEAGKDFFYSIDKNSNYYKINKRITNLILNNIEVSSSAMGFRSGSSYFNFIEPHRKNYNFLRLDVTSYFHSIRSNNIRSTLEAYVTNERLGEKHDSKIIDYIMNYCTLTLTEDSKNTPFIGKEILPIGYPSSPIISNIVFRKIDIQIKKYCFDNGILYTRYADDMLFSSKEKNKIILSEEFSKNISILLWQLGLKLNKKKTLNKKHTISLNGYVIDNNSGNGSIRISCKKLKKINKVTQMFLRREHSPSYIMKSVYNTKIEDLKFDFKTSKKFYKKYCRDQLKNKLVGYRSYIISIIKFGKKNSCIDDEILFKYSTIIKRIELCIDKV